MKEILRTDKTKTPFNTFQYKPKSNIEKLRAEKRNFLKEFSTKYGYNGKINQIRENEYPQLRNIIYLDHAGAATHAKRMLINFKHDTLNNLYSSPYSCSVSSQASSRRICLVRKRILKYFNTNEREYNVIFTQNSTTAIKLIVEIFPWTEKSNYKYLKESHNSFNDLERFLELINSKDIQGLTENDVKKMINNIPPSDDDNTHGERDDEEIMYNLFAYPAQCNYSGTRFPLDWVSKIKKLNTRKSKTLVLLDAADYVPSSSLSLANKETSPDFVCLSFYKMFGFPTGLGALIVKTELNPILQEGYFDKSKDLATRYEGGTVDFLNIIALDHAFDTFENLYGNIENISNHVTCLNTFLSRNMRSFRHWNGQRVCMINSGRDYSNSERQGGVLSFNVKRSDGSLVGYLEIEKLANMYGIHIRSDENINVRAEKVSQHSSEGNDDRDTHEGKLNDTVRVSMGAMTTIEDILIWLDFFNRHYVEIGPGKTIHNLSTSITHIGGSV